MFPSEMDLPIPFNSAQDGELTGAQCTFLGQIIMCNHARLLLKLLKFENG